VVSYRAPLDGAGQHATICGATPLSNLFLNTGRGRLGWIMACTSRKLLSGLMQERLHSRAGGHCEKKLN